MAVDANIKARLRRTASFHALASALTVLSSVLLFAWTAAGLRAVFLEILAVDLRRATLRSARYNRHGRPYVVMTATTAAYFPFVANMRCSLKSATSDARLLVAALDPGVIELAHKAGCNPVSISQPLHRFSVAKFGTRAFREITRRKLVAVQSVLKLGIDVIFVDGDVHFCDNLNQVFHIVNETKANIVAQRTDVTSELINSGVYFVRASLETVHLFEELRAFDAANDQVAFNALMCRSENGGTTLLQNPSNKKYITGCRRRNVTLAFLPEHSFPLGCTSFQGTRMLDVPSDVVTKKCRRKNIVLLHYSCWSSWNKKKQMKRRSMWKWNERLQKCID